MGKGKRTKKKKLEIEKKYRDSERVEVTPEGRRLHLTPEDAERMKLVLEESRRLFVEKHGREPGPDDLIFEDMPHPEVMEHEMVQAMKRAGTRPELIYAYEKTSRLVTEDNRKYLTQDELDEWEDAIDEYFLLEEAKDMEPPP